MTESPSATDQKPIYRFGPGDQFAYQTEILMESSGTASKLAGAVFFDVRHVYGKDDIHLHAIGRLKYSRRSSENGGFELVPAKDVWIGPFIRLDQSATSFSGREDLDPGSLPPSLNQLIGLKRLYFVELPETFGAATGHSKPGMFFDHGGSIWSGSTINAVKGREDYSIQADPPTAGVAIIRRIKAIYATEGDKRSYRCESTSKLDVTSGRLLETRAKATFEAGGRTEGAIDFMVRRLTGAEFERARLEASATLKQRPRSLFPYELLRERVELPGFTHKFLKSAEEAAPGTMVAHLRSSDMINTTATLKDFDHKFYRARVIERESGINELKIRYAGSDEELIVKPYTLVKVDG